ncbi:MAG: hypothetical protein MJ185_04925 [Treponema sp.]|nr:hypothetical protein [Treponema sp.]
MSENKLEGHLKINKSAKYPRVYLISKSTGPDGKYLGKKDRRVISQYCQRDYERKILRESKTLIGMIEAFLEKLPLELSSESLENFLSEKNQIRRKYLTKSVLSDEEFVEEWLSVEYKGKAFLETDTELVTDRGERVRSKSEMLIANKLASLGIPYRYEFPHKLRDRHGFKITVYPDFTLLNKETRKEIILEHFGRMDDPEYVSHTLEKLNLYGRNGIFPGDRLIFTTETSRHPFDMRLFEKQLKGAGII